MTRIKKIILDFDGTLTDVEAESVPAIAKWHELYSEKTGIAIGKLKLEFSFAKQRVLNDRKSGWTNNGYVVAPATADPLVFTTTAYQKLIERQISNGTYPLATDQKSIDAFLYELFSTSYPHSDTIFRKGAKEFLDELSSEYSVTIVTNSKVNSVEDKLSKLVNYSLPIIGNAKKYEIGEGPDYVPESVDLHGFPRLVFLRRTKYSAILQEFERDETAVIGDIYELDLALPEYLGFKVIQLQTESTPNYETAHHRSKKDNLITKDYRNILLELRRS